MSPALELWGRRLLGPVVLFKTITPPLPRPESALVEEACLTPPCFPDPVGPLEASPPRVLMQLSGGRRESIAQQVFLPSRGLTSRETVSVLLNSALQINRKRLGELSRVWARNTERPGSDPGASTSELEEHGGPSKPQFLHLCSGYNHRTASQGCCGVSHAQPGGLRVTALPAAGPFVSSLC